MDVQGAEGLVLSGAADTLRRSPNLTVVLEFWPHGLSRTGHDARVLLENLRNAGFRIFDLGDKFRPIRTGADFDALVGRLQGRRYTNLVASRTIEALR